MNSIKKDDWVLWNGWKRQRLGVAIADYDRYAIIWFDNPISRKQYCLPKDTARVDLRDCELVPDAVAWMQAQHQARFGKAKQQRDAYRQKKIAEVRRLCTGQVAPVRILHNAWNIHWSTAAAWLHRAGIVYDRSLRCWVAEKETVKPI